MPPDGGKGTFKMSICINTDVNKMIALLDCLCNTAWERWRWYKKFKINLQAY